MFSRFHAKDEMMLNKTFTELLLELFNIVPKVSPRGPDRAPLRGTWRSTGQSYDPTVHRRYDGNALEH